ncbi:MAG: phosphatase PAP2 family protein [Solirubrobacterales bacterium]
MAASPLDSGAPAPGGWREEIDRLDLAVYAAIAATPTPRLDHALRRLSQAADHSKLWLASSAALALAGGARGRRAAVNGLVSTAATAAVVNAILKPGSARRRPDRLTHAVPVARHVRMPRTRSFPSGHAASAFAFATGVAGTAPAAGVPLSALAALVAYSRVHTGVHYPLDVVAGAVTGAALAPVAIAAADRRRGRPHR